MSEKQYYPSGEDCAKSSLVRLEWENPTVAENIDRKIRYHQQEIARLEEAKVQMAPLLHMKLGDMREVMSY